MNLANQRIGRFPFTSSVCLTFFLLFLLPFQAAAFSKDQGVNMEALIKNLVREDFGVSYAAEEVAIFFSHNQPSIHRYRIGILKPHKMKRIKYRIDGTVEDVVVQDDELRIEYYPGGNTIVRNPRNRTAAAIVAREKELVSLIKANYEIRPGGSAVIAERSAFIFSLQPKREGTRPSFKVWMDHETSLPLKTEVYSLKGELTYLSSLSGIVWNPSFPRDYFVIMVPEGTEAFEVETSPPAARSFLHDDDFFGRGHPANLPGGFALKEVREEDEGQMQGIYHDGLNSLSVFVERIDKEIMKALHDFKGLKGKKIEVVSIGALEGVFCGGDRENILSYFSGGKKVTIVGEISRGLLIEIASKLAGKGIKK